MPKPMHMLTMSRRWALSHYIAEARVAAISYPVAFFAHKHTSELTGFTGDRSLDSWRLRALPNRAVCSFSNRSLSKRWRQR